MTDLLTATKCDLLAEVARNSGQARVQVTGLSMLPAIWPGDVLTIEHQTHSQFRKGQIAVFVRDGGLVVHRVIRANSPVVVTRGDSLPSADAPVWPEEVIGRVSGIAREGRDVPVEQSLAQRALGLVLRRSDMVLRVLLRLRRLAWAA